MIRVLDRMTIDSARHGYMDFFRKILPNMSKYEAQRLMSRSAGQLSDAFVLTFRDYIDWGDYILSGSEHALDQYMRLIFNADQL